MKAYFIFIIKKLRHKNICLEEYLDSKTIALK